MTAQTHQKLVTQAARIYAGLLLFVLAVTAGTMSSFGWPAILSVVPLLWTCRGFARDGSLEGVALGAGMVPVWWAHASHALGPPIDHPFAQLLLLLVPSAALLLGVVALAAWLRPLRAARPRVLAR
jgi:apolipoprotein N-acyltransferase